MQAEEKAHAQDFADAHDKIRRLAEALKEARAASPNGAVPAPIVGSPPRSNYGQLPMLARQRKVLLIS